MRTLMLAEGDSGLVGDLLKKRPADLLVCDLPYGVQHAPQNGKKAESFPKLLERILPAWRWALKPGGAAAISFNTLTQGYAADAAAKRRLHAADRAAV